MSKARTPGKMSSTISLLAILILCIVRSVAAEEQVPASHPERGSSDDGGDPLEEIIVTATKRGVNIQKLPQSLVALPGSVLEAIGAESFQDLTQQVAGLNLSKPGKVGQKSVNIRGISQLGNGDADFATVGFYIDETPISDASNVADFALFDVDRVEVLRGPQGTLFGEGSLGGVVRILVNRPDPEAFSAKAEASYATIDKGGDEYRVVGMLNMPLVSDRIAARVVGGYVENGGFVDNIRTGSKDVDGSEVLHFRGALGFETGENLNVLTSLTYQSTSGRGASFDEEDTADLTQERAIDGNYEDDVLLFNLTVDYDFGGATLTSATSYFDRDLHREYDMPTVTLGIAAIFMVPPDLVSTLFPSGTIEVDDLPTETFTQEIRLVSSDGGPLEWLVGGFYRKRDNSVGAFLDQDELPGLTGGILTSDVFEIDHSSTFEHVALFGEATYDLSERWHLTGGVRVFRETVTSDASMAIPIAGVGPIPSTTRSRNNDVQYKAALSYDISDQAMLYLNFSEGFRPGGFNFRLLAPTIPPTFESDTTRNYELGLKSSWNERRVTANVALYSTDWTDAQLADLTLGAANFTFNAGRVRILGAELEVSAKPIDGLDLGINLGYNDSELQEDTISLASGQQLASKGDVLPFAPKTTYNIYAAYEVPLTSSLAGFGRVDYSHVDKFNTDFGIAGAASTLPSYDILDLHVGVRIERWSVTAFVANATDERAVLNVIDPANHGLLRNQPRTIGITLRTEF